jgi:hypothetical protein
MLRHSDKTSTIRNQDVTLVSDAPPGAEMRVWAAWVADASR